MQTYQERSLERSMLAELIRSSGRIEGKVDALNERVNRIEDREHGKRTMDHHVKPWTPRDYLLSATGIALVLAAAFDKIPWSVVSTFISAMK